MSGNDGDYQKPINSLTMLGYGSPAAQSTAMQNTQGNNFFDSLFGGLGISQQPQDNAQGFQVAASGPYQIRPDGRVVDIRTGQVRYDGHGNLTPQQAAQMLNRGGR